MRRIGTVGITLLGLVFLAQAVSALLSTVWLYDAGNELGLPLLAYLATYAPVLLFAVAGSALIIYRERLAVRWFGEDDESSGSMDPELALRVGILLLGLYVSIYAVSGLVSAVLQPIVSAASDRMLFGAEFVEDKPLASFLPGIGSAAVELLLGCGLIWFSGQLSRWLWTHERPQRAIVGMDSRPMCRACGARYDPADYTEGANARCVECGQPLDIGGA